MKLIVKFVCNLMVNNPQLLPQIVVQMRLTYYDEPNCSFLLIVMKALQECSQFIYLLFQNLKRDSKILEIVTQLLKMASHLMRIVNSFLVTQQGITAKAVGIFAALQVEPF